MRVRLLAIIVVSALLGVLWLSLASGRRAVQSVSDVIFPPQDIPLRFSHQGHLRRGTRCDACHAAAKTSMSSLDNLLPTEAECRTCHAIDRDKPTKSVASGKGPARCDACHTRYTPDGGGMARVRIPIPNIKFDHKRHARDKIPCSTCHGDLLRDKVDLATRAQLPTMSVCLTCHKPNLSRGRCTTCHLAGTGGFMQTSYASGKLTPSGRLLGAAHTLQFARKHTAVAQSNPDYCSQCHTKEFCIDCHNGVVKPMSFHVGDYLTMHTVEARRNTPNCSTCHRVQTFCVGCHSRSGVSADRRGSEFAGPSTGIAGRRFHPLGWVDVNGVGTPQAGARGALHHAFQAQRNIRQCASCHREQFCVRCHTAQRGGFRVNPHPANWARSRRCRALSTRVGRMCSRCHTDPAERGCNWRGMSRMRRR